MNIQQMKYVVAVANNGSFREAAKKNVCFTTKSFSWYQRIRDRVRNHAIYSNESRCIFNRRRTRFLKSCRKILVQLDTLESHYLTSEKRENFSIAAQHYDFLGPLTAQLLEEFKDEIKQFRIMETTTARVIEKSKSSTVKSALFI